VASCAAWRGGGQQQRQQSPARVHARANAAVGLTSILDRRLLVLWLLCCGAYRTNKSPLIFAAKTEREMREWMMAIKLLAEKLQSTESSRADGSAAPVGGAAAPTPPTRAVAMRRLSQQSQQQLLAVSRRDDVTRRSSPQLLQTTDNGRWAAGLCHVTCASALPRRITTHVWHENAAFCYRWSSVVRLSVCWSRP